MEQVEQRVRKFYDVAGRAYQALMGEYWHHGRMESDQAGLTPAESAKALERELLDDAGLGQGAGFGKRALDFGAGVGGPTVHMADYSKLHFTGVSNNEWLSTEARQHAAALGMSSLAAFHTIGDVEYRDLNAWPNDCLDAVTFFESVCHLPDKPAFFRAVARILKPGGWLLGVDWLQRRYGDHQTDEQIRRFIEPFDEYISIPELGTLDQYHKMIAATGLVVETAEDLYDAVPCWGSTPENDGQGWFTYDGVDSRRFAEGKRVLDNARAAGVFTVGKFVAYKPAR